jgi:hypothetical protein
VYQYTFRYGDSGESWIMMWDYNIGLVRITHLFKALGYTKVFSSILHTKGIISSIKLSVSNGSALDNPSQSSCSESRTARHLPQHHWRSNCSPRYLIPSLRHCMTPG